MLKISADNVASQLNALLESVAREEEVILVEEDREVARLVPPLGQEQWLNRTRQFREPLHVQGEASSATVIRARQQERG